MVTINLLEVSCCVTEFNQDFDLRQLVIMLIMLELTGFLYCLLLVVSYQVMYLE